MIILILATSIKNTAQKQLVAPELDSMVGNKNWSIDLDDVDKVLRIVSNTDVLFNVIDVLRQYRVNTWLMEVFDTSEGPSLLQEYATPIRPQMAMQALH